MHSVDLPSLESNKAFLLYYLTELLYMKTCLMPRAMPCLLLNYVRLLQPHGPGSSVHGIFQERILEQVAISLSRGSSGPRDQARVSCVSYTGKRVLYHRHLGIPHTRYQGNLYLICSYTIGVPNTIIMTLLRNLNTIE